MSFLDALSNLLFGTAPRPMPHLALPPQPVARPDIKLEVSKAMRQLMFADRAWALGIWSSETYVADFTHDVELMRAVGDLTGIRLQLLDRFGAVCGEFAIDFLGDGKRVDPVKVDSAGIELPVVDRHSIASHRVIVNRIGLEEKYRPYLRLSWGPALNLRQTAGDQYASEHAAKITGGRQTGTFFVGSSARHLLVITNGPQNGKGNFAFARDETMNQDGIFVMRKHAPNVPFIVGTRLTGVVVSTPKGLQIRAARLPA